jgi:heme-degrading monooxygenase HmoA
VSQEVVLEVAMLDVRSGSTAEFEMAFAEAQKTVRTAPGYISHELQRCIERPNRYILLVRWQRLEDHTDTFRKSPQYQDWKRLLHHFYDPFPTVEHFKAVNL